MDTIYTVRRMKNDYELPSGDILTCGSRVLMGEDKGGYFIIAERELSTNELNEELIENECFNYLFEVTTRKGSLVKVYEDIETGETFFNIFG